MEEEIWKPIKGYEGLYEASNLGRIRSMCKKNIKIINGTFVKNKIYIRFKDGYFQKSFLVAKTFLLNPNNYTKVLHIDGNTINDTINNLKFIDTFYSYCTICNKKIKETHGEGFATKCSVCKNKEFRLLNPVKIKEYKKTYKNKNPFKNLEYNKKQVLNITDVYCKQKLYRRGINLSCVTNDLIEIQRILIKTKRLCKISEI